MIVLSLCYISELIIFEREVAKYYKKKKITDTKVL